MKNHIIRAATLLPFVLLVQQARAQQVVNPGTVVQTDAANHANTNINNSVNNTLNSAESTLKGFFKKKKNPTPAATPAATTQPATANTVDATATGTPGSSTTLTPLSSYQNYDFVPGNNILFEDEFTDDQSGEFPTHWDLKSGQGILNMVGTDKAFFLTDGNYVKVQPLMKNNAYLTNSFSVEYDFYANGGYPAIIEIVDANESGTLTSIVKQGGVEWTGYTAKTDKGTSFASTLPADLSPDKVFLNQWHHVAIAYKNDQMKIYIDKYRVLLVPHCNGLAPAYLRVMGIGSQDRPIIFKNFKIADGVQFYMTGQKFTDAKIVTHGINFDIDKATITPPSMGTLNMIVQVLTANPDLKFEVDGHTDNTGTAAHNLVLSQQRADAVVAQLVSMGIDASRLTSKGFGDTKPIADNTTLEGKANNRRVEFVKI